jgi:hypothetical protein
MAPVAMKRLLLILGMAVSLAGPVLAVLIGPYAGTSSSAWPLTWVIWPIVGWMILSKRPGNRVGIACFVIGVAQGITFGLSAFVLEMPPTVASWVELGYTILGIVPWFTIIWLLIVFPSGFPTGTIGKWLNRLLFVLATWASIGFLFSPAPLADTGLANPMARPDLTLVTSIADESGFLLVIALTLAAIASIFGRWRRSTGVERQQFRWLLFGGAVFISVLSLGQVVADDWNGGIFWLLGNMAIPAAIGVAITRYRLYEIDRLISRTVSYVLVIGLLVGVYAGLVAVLQVFVPSDNPLVVAASTLAVAALFNPVRKRIQYWVDRRFNRSRYDAERVMDSFASTLRDRVEIGDVVDGWVGVVSETMQPTAVGVWIRDRV